MLENSLILLISVIAITIIFDFINGFNDAANAIATCISTRALSIKTAVIMAAILNLAGAVISTKVATTIGTDIIDATHITQIVLLAAVSAAIFWGIFTWYFGIPSSSSHALIGGIVGAAAANSGFATLHWSGLKLIILALVLSPILGIIVGLVLMVAILWIVHKGSPYMLNKAFRKLQIISAAVMALSHGVNDAQKSMGVITLALVSFGTLQTFTVPWQVILGCALAIALGTISGGWRIIKTVGKDFVELQPVHGFCVQTASAGVILATSAVGMPASTTHVLTAAILGVGISRRLSAVNWKIAYHIVMAWLLTIPAVGTIAYGLESLIHFLSK
jgi:inorganic phosphate transporter, PiT family